MFNVGGPEIMVVILVALVVLGPEQLPKAMRSFGNVMAQVRKVSSGFQDEMRSAMHSLDQPTVGSGSSGSGTTGGSTTASTTSEPTTTAPTAAEPPADAPSPGSTTTGSTPSSPAAPFVDPVTDRPGASPADRAAG